MIQIFQVVSHLISYHEVTTGVQKLQFPGCLADESFVQCHLIFEGPQHETCISHHLSGVWNFEVVSRFFENLCTAELLELFREFYDTCVLLDK